MSAAHPVAGKGNTPHARSSWPRLRMVGRYSRHARFAGPMIWNGGSTGYTKVSAVPISRRHFLASSLALPVFAGKAPPARPNIVLFLVDNLPAFMLGCYGNKEIRTPHIDLLCQTGTRFLRNFACTPVPDISRATLLTGLTPMQLHESGAIRSGAATLESTLQSAGYTAHTAGPADASVFLESQTPDKPFFLTVNHTTLRPPYDGVAAKYHDLYSGQKFEGYAPDPPSPTARE